MADFIFRNREVIFSADKNAEQQRIIKVIAVTFPIDVAGIILENVKTAVPDEQKPLWEAGQRLVKTIQIQQTSQDKSYYVIAMTSSSSEDIANEINRVRRRVGSTFDTEFPNFEICAPEGGLYTLLISGNGLPYTQASALKQKAIASGFSKDTWFWQSSVEYFSPKKN